MKIVEVTQFYGYGMMTWSELIESKGKPVLLSADKKNYLWKEYITIKEVEDSDEPLIGDVWLMEGKNNTIKIFKTNYDSSD